MKLVPSSSIRIRVISSIRLGLFRNHQQPKTIRLPNFRAATHSSCWFSRASIVTKNRFSGNSRQRFTTDCTSDLPTMSPASRSAGFTRSREPIIIANGRFALGADRQDDLLQHRLPGAGDRVVRRRPG